MIYLEYLLAASIVVILSIKASKYVDLLDKNTMLSGAFLGGILLSAVTSLPEFFTSISATIMLDRPGMCMGNILGSNLFNLAELAFFTLVFFKIFSKGRVSRSYRHVAVMVLLIYGLIVLNFTGVLHFNILHISVTSILIVLIYAVGTKYLAVAEDYETDEDLLDYHAASATKLSVQQICFRLFLSAIGIIFSSIILTYLTEELAVKLDLGQGIAGAILLGIATSLPELSSTVALLRMKNCNIAVGNIVGSNMFNFIILSAADMISAERSVYAVLDHEIRSLMIFGAAATAIIWIMLWRKNRTTQLVCSLGILLCYLAFLVLWRV